MSTEIAALEAEIKEYKLQLETVQLGLQSDPDNAELLELKNELDQVIALSQSAIADLAPQSAPLKATPKYSPASAAAPEKWKREDHPKFRDAAAAAPAAEEEESRESRPNFQVNDTVLAKWHSGDKGFYPARITSITGSSVDPVYIVKFKSYDTVETLRGRDVKAISTAAKRKADGTPVAAGSGERKESSGGVISAEAEIDRDAQMTREREASKVGDGPVRPERAPKKIKANKELEKGKSKWQDWAAKGMGKKGTPGVKKKESMFRTPEGVHGRVGFTGSGQSMRKDPSRSRHIYQTNGDEEGLQ
ncbi:hypothetical protein V493_08565 [Pseudogymnoascus sp. VKM F-4281 (FW-2241)]|nr:hypothetical protein V493_08565 [Pseudogymnoascus sp. VKM F-4281 (FW-2241)]